jgi:demethylmenaquinone methyltransferase / 2-methoxy-6-polyprenyl-1,4-benzoquinol methylase
MNAMIEAKSSTDQVRRVYNLWSRFYGPLAEVFERKPKLMALERAAIQPQDKVLEVAIGPGKMLLEILKSIDGAKTVHGVDLSPKMIEQARRLVSAAGHSNFDLQVADARNLPFSSDIFDVVFNSYMLDLIPLKDMPLVLAEFQRVLKPGGRLVLVNLSKVDSDRSSWWERAYKILPSTLETYILGGCRPVLMQELVERLGFCDVHREFVRQLMPTEIVTAKKPSR